MNWETQNALVIGSGISGIAATKLLESKGAKVTLFDSNEKKSPEEIREKLGTEFQGEVLVGTLPENIKGEITLLVISPGVPIDCSMVLEFQSKGIPVWGEIELAYVCGKGRLIAITGTNGKTTTTALTGEILKTWFPSVFVVGNIGTPYAGAVDAMTQDSITVAEISSFQLESIHTFCPEESAILNLTPDHLNRHHTMENYVDTKCSIYKNQGKDSTVVLNYEDPLLRERAEQVPGHCIFFSSKSVLTQGWYLQGEEIVYANAGEKEVLCNVHELQILGVHNYENVMAAAALSYSFGVPMDCIRKAVKAFHAVPHRIEFVAEVNQVKYYNDSKGTNPDAAIQGIRAMLSPTCLIGGGYDKGSSYDEWIEAFDGKVKKLVLIGDTADAIENCARKHQFTQIVRAKSLKEAVVLCASFAQPGDSVLLSPACASWDMFDNYEQRGDLFREYVKELPQG